jgi:hypothetical protein
MGPNFFNLRLINSGADLEVSGTFDTHGDVIDDVLIRFLIIPNTIPAALTGPIVGTATIPHDDLNPGPQSCRITSGNFSATVPNNYGLAADDKARAIGITVAVKAVDPPGPVDPQDAPAFETFTWCVNVKVTV